MVAQLQHSKSTDGLSITRCMLHAVVCCMLSVACWLLHVICRMLHGVCCTLQFQYSESTDGLTLDYFPMAKAHDEDPSRAPPPVPGPRRVAFVACCHVDMFSCRASCVACRMSDARCMPPCRVLPVACRTLHVACRHKESAPRCNDRCGHPRRGRRHWARASRAASPWYACNAACNSDHATRNLRRTTHILHPSRGCRDC
jgi:hypothetical protein